MVDPHGWELRDGLEDVRFQARRQTFEQNADLWNAPGEDFDGSIFLAVSHPKNFIASFNSGHRGLLIENSYQRLGKYPM